MRVDRLVDTNFLINRWRNGDSGSAFRYAERNSGLSLAMPWVVKAEFLRGVAVARHDHREARGFLNRYPTVWPDDALLDTYAGLFAELRGGNRLPGPHDLWIASAAVHFETPLVTRNHAEFGRVPGIEIDPY